MLNDLIITKQEAYKKRKGQKFLANIVRTTMAMNYVERENLKREIETDLLTLERESWDPEIKMRLIKILEELNNIELEGKDK